MFPILFYIDVTQARKEEVVIVRREIAEGLNRWMAMKKTDLESDYGRSNRKIQDTVNTHFTALCRWKREEPGAFLF